MTERADRAARGSDVPAGIERGGDAAARTGSRERGRMRRRLRELRRLREAKLVELGALVLEAHRHDRDDSPVVKQKATEVATIDTEARRLAEALDSDAGLDTVVAAGIAGPCPTCGTLASTAARFCSACGTALDGRPDAARREEPARVEAAEAPVPEASEPEPAVAEDRTTELPAPNGNGTTAEELEATSGRES